jgi:hypothetical protein
MAHDQQSGGEETQQGKTSFGVLNKHASLAIIALKPDPRTRTQT